ncbi:kelch-like protein 28 isoform X2 [Oculina patagonica]
MVAHSEILLSKCAQFREEGEFIDVRLKVSEDVFPAHRIVLAANSDYFHAMFTDGKESNQEVIKLEENVSPDAFKIVMDSIYTGDLLVNEGNVFEVLTTAVQLRVTSVVQQCCDFLKREFIELRLDLHNYSLLCSFADRHGLKDLKEAAEHKMASMYKDVCEKDEFLTHIDADQLFSLLSRDDLSAPSETFVFKSVMQWIKHKKEERMAVAAKVLGAVRLGLVDIKTVIEELGTEEMQRVPEINMHLQESMMHNYMPSHNSKFAVEKTKPRSMSPVLVAIYPTKSLQPSADRELSTLRASRGIVEPETMVYYFDAETKIWKPMPSVVQLVSLKTLPEK